MAAFYRGPSGGIAATICGSAAETLGNAWYYESTLCTFDRDETVVELAVEWDTPPSTPVEVAFLVDGGTELSFDTADDGSVTGDLEVPADTEWYLRIGPGDGDWTGASVVATLNTDGPAVRLPLVGTTDT